MVRSEKISRRFGKNDVIFLGILVVLIIVFLLIFYGGKRSETGNCVVVTVDGEAFGTYSLEKDQTVEIKDAKGTVTNTLIIAEGCAKMEEADCPDRLCVKQRKISKNRENIVCLPNKVVVTVENGGDSGIDAIAN